MLEADVAELAAVVGAVRADLLDGEAQSGSPHSPAVRILDEPVVEKTLQVRTLDGLVTVYIQYLYICIHL